MLATKLFTNHYQTTRTAGSYTLCITTLYSDVDSDLKYRCIQTWTTNHRIHCVQHHCILSAMVLVSTLRTKMTTNASSSTSQANIVCGSHNRCIASISEISLPWRSRTSVFAYMSPHVRRRPTGTTYSRFTHDVAYLQYTNYIVTRSAESCQIFAGWRP